MNKSIYVYVSLLVISSHLVCAEESSADQQSFGAERVALLAATHTRSQKLAQKKLSSLSQRNAQRTPSYAGVNYDLLTMEDLGKLLTSSLRVNDAIKSSPGITSTQVSFKIVNGNLSDSSEESVALEAIEAPVNNQIYLIQNPGTLTLEQYVDGKKFGEHTLTVTQ